MVNIKSVMLPKMFYRRDLRFEITCVCVRPVVSCSEHTHCTQSLTQIQIFHWFQQDQKDLEITLKNGGLEALTEIKFNVSCLQRSFIEICNLKLGVCYCVRPLVS